jgi:hypothetical protein
MEENTFGSKIEKLRKCQGFLLTTIFSIRLHFGFFD